MSHELPPESEQPALSAESQEAFVRLIKGKYSPEGWDDWRSVES